MEYILQLILLILIAKLLGEVVKRAGLHPIVTDILTGIVLGPFLLGIVKPSIELKALADFGLILLMLYTGLTSDFKAISGKSKVAILIGMSGAFTTIALTFTACLILGLPLIIAFIVSIALSNTATETLAAILSKEKVDKEANTILIGASFVDDILAVYLINLIACGIEFKFEDILYLTIKMLLFIFIVIKMSGFIVRKYWKYLYALFSDTPRTLIFSLIIAFTLAFISREIGLSEVVGAYLGGLMVSRIREVHDPLLINVIRLSSLVSEVRFMLETVFTTLFFIYVGLLFNPDIKEISVTLTIVLVIVAFLGKFIGCFVPLILMGYGRRLALIVGIGMESRGALETAILRFALENKMISTEIYATIIVVLLTTSIITPILFRYVNKKFTV